MSEFSYSRATRQLVGNQCFLKGCFNKAKKRRRLLKSLEYGNTFFIFYSPQKYFNSKGQKTKQQNQQVVAVLLQYIVVLSSRKAAGNWIKLNLKSNPSDILLIQNQAQIILKPGLWNISANKSIFQQLWSDNRDPFFIASSFNKSLRFIENNPEIGSFIINNTMVWK